MEYIGNFLFEFVGISYILLWLCVLVSIYRKEPFIEIVAEFLIYIFCIFFLGLRDFSSGSDTLRYVESFNRIDALNEYIVSWEPIYNFFAYLVSNVGNSQGFILANVLIQLLLISLAGRMAGVKTKSLVLLLYISLLPGFDMLTNGLRQGLSSVLALIIFLLWIKGGYLKKTAVFGLFILHKSILIHVPFFILFPFLNKINIRRWTNLLIVFFFGIIFFWHFVDFSQSLKSIADLFSYQLETSAMTAGEKFNAYLENEQNMLSGTYKYYFLFISTIILVGIPLFRFKLEPLEGFHNIEILSFLVCFLAIPYALIWSSPFSYRFMYIFFLPGLFLITLGIENSKKDIYMLFMIFVLIMAVLTYGSNTFNSFNY